MTPYPIARDRSDTLYDSRKTSGAKGIGYPSCNTELALRTPNTKDPHGYYRDLGVDPGATPEQIRRAVRRKLYELHPDTGGTDPEAFQRIHRIAQVLLDETARERYDATPEGMRLMDAVYEAELSKMDGLTTLIEIQLEQVLKPQKAANPHAPGLGSRYDYFARGQPKDFWKGDSLKAQLWYHFLIQVAPMVGYRRKIKVLITDEEPEYHHGVNLMMIPRRWEPSSALALSLFTVVAGFRPGKDDPQTR